MNCELRIATGDECSYFIRIVFDGYRLSMVGGLLNLPSELSSSRNCTMRLIAYLLAYDVLFKRSPSVRLTDARRSKNHCDLYMTGPKLTCHINRFIAYVQADFCVAPVPLTEIRPKGEDDLPLRPNDRL